VLAVWLLVCAQGVREVAPEGGVRVLAAGGAGEVRAGGRWAVLPGSEAPWLASASRSCLATVSAARGFLNPMQIPPLPCVCVRVAKYCIDVPRASQSGGSGGGVL